MMENGWYAIENIRKETTLHYFLKGKSICPHYKNITETSDRLSKPDIINEIEKCTLCERSLPFFEKFGMSQTQFEEFSRKKKLKRSKTLAVEKLPIEKYNQIQTICPSCKTKVCFYTDGNPKEHYCTVCNEIVTLPKEILA